MQRVCSKRYPGTLGARGSPTNRCGRRRTASSPGRTVISGEIGATRSPRALVHPYPAGSSTRRIGACLVRGISSGPRLGSITRRCKSSCRAGAARVQVALRIGTIPSRSDDASGAAIPDGARAHAHAHAHVHASPRRGSPAATPESGLSRRGTSEPMADPVPEPATRDDSSASSTQARSGEPGR